MRNEIVGKPLVVKLKLPPLAQRVVELLADDLAPLRSLLRGAMAGLHTGELID